MASAPWSPLLFLSLIFPYSSVAPLLQVGSLLGWFQQPGLEPGQNPAWDLNPWPFIRITYLVSGFTEAQILSHLRKNSVKGKVTGKKWIYSDSERSTLHRQSVGCCRGWVWPQKVTWLVFIGRVISYANEWENYSNCSWEGVESSKNWATHQSLVFWQFHSNWAISNHKRWCY